MKGLQIFVRYGFYPALLIGMIASFFLLREHFSVEQLPLLVGILSLASILLIHITEQFFPYRAEWNISQGDFPSDFFFTNIALPTLSKTAEILLGFLFLKHASAFVQEHVHPLWPSQWPLLVQLALALLIAEFFFYWIHRWGHTVLTLWRFHSIHHSVKRIYWNNAGVFHPVDLFLNWMIYFFPLFLFGVSPDVIALFLLTNAVTGLMEHTNIDFEMGPLNRIFNTAQLHRWHHSELAKISSNNYGKVLSVWDSVFGTWFMPRNEQVGELGVEGDEVPLEFFPRMTYPFQALRRDFKKS